MKKIDRKKKAEAVKDYLSSGDTLVIVAARHGMCTETLRKAVGPRRMKKKMKTSAKKRTVGVQGSFFPEVVVASSKKISKDVSFENNHKAWGATDISLLIDSVNDGLTVSETAKLLGRTNAAVSTRKHILIREGKIRDEVRFPVPEGIKRYRRGVEEPEVQPVVEVEVEKERPGASIEHIDLMSLADLVKRFGLNVTITIDKGVTTVNMF